MSRLGSVVLERDSEKLVLAALHKHGFKVAFLDPGEAQTSIRRYLQPGMGPIGDGQGFAGWCQVYAVGCPELSVLQSRPSFPAEDADPLLGMEIR